MTTTNQYGQQAEQTGPKLLTLVVMFVLIWYGYKKANR